MIAPIAAVDSDDLAVVPLYADFLTEVGLADQDYLDVQRRQSATVGGIHAHTLWRTERNTDANIKAYFALSSKALVANAEKQVALMNDTLAKPKFTEHKRLKELVSQRTQRRLNSITGSGHSLAMSAAAAAHNPLANLQDYLSGLRSTQALKALNEKLNSKSELEAFAEQLSGIHTRLRAGSWQHLVIGEEQHMNTLAGQLVGAAATSVSDRVRLTQVPLDLADSKQLWLTNTQVYFCAKAYKTVNSDHEDGPALTVLGGLLRNGFLHRAIREQGGAYGGGASQDSGSGVFRFYSYRDPRFGGTLDDFDASLDWLRRNEFTDEALEEAILGVIASLDKPGSPAGTCKQHFHNRLFDRTHQDREAFRQRILACSREDIERAANRYFDPNSASIAVVAPKGTEDTESALVNTLGLNCFQV
jgi:Zn-dependent M16 (insulinase) family peptidase